MKTLANCLFIVLLSPLALVANDGKYVEAMQKSIKAIYEAEDITSLQAASNSFERIAGAEKSHWEPLYYLAFANIMMANLEENATQKDAYLDRAMEAIRDGLKPKPVYGKQGGIAQQKTDGGQLVSREA